MAAAGAQRGGSTTGGCDTVACYIPLCYKLVGSTGGPAEFCGTRATLAVPFYDADDSGFIWDCPASL